MLSYNNFSDTDECLRSLLAQDHPNLSIILVDNGSGDGSLERLRDGWAGKVDFVETGRNLGVAGGYNAGITSALEKGADYVVLCNNDIVVDPAFVSALVDVFASHPDTAIAVPVMTYYDAPDLIWFGWVDQQPALFYSINRLRDEPVAALAGRAGRVFESAYVTTCASMISREAVGKVGLLDERFFFGHDDVDWSLRARRLGMKCRVLGRPLVRHKVSVTSGVRGSNLLTPLAAYRHASAGVLIGAKHFRNLAAPGFFFGLLAIRAPYNVATLLLARRWGSALAYLKGLFTGLVRYAPHAFGPRRS